MTIRNLRTRVKICCISDPLEAKMAIDAGADAIGLVGPMPSGPGIIDNEMINIIAKSLPASVSSFLLTSETQPETIINHYNKVNTSTIQFVDEIKLIDYKTIRSALPHVKLVQVIHVLDESAIDQTIEASNFVDTILLDSGNPNKAVKELGGTGRKHNWEISQSIVEKCKVPVFLAGGLNPKNIQTAINTVKPFGVDICSGIRTNGKLDQSKLNHFFSALKT